MWVGFCNCFTTLLNTSFCALCIFRVAPGFVLQNLSYFSSQFQDPSCLPFSREQPIFSTRAHVFQIDPTTKRNWIPASKHAVTVSFFYDANRNAYRIISVGGTKVSTKDTIIKRKLSNRNILMKWLFSLISKVVWWHGWPVSIWASRAPFLQGFGLWGRGHIRDWGEGLFSTYYDPYFCFSEGRAGWCSVANSLLWLHSNLQRCSGCPACYAKHVTAEMWSLHNHFLELVKQGVKLWDF